MNPSLSVSNKQIDYVFKQLQITGWPHTFVVAVTTYMIWRTDANPGIIAWFGVMQFSHFLRVKVLDPLWRHANTEELDYFRTRMFLTLGMLWSGTLWAAIPTFFMHDPQSEAFVFVSITLAGMICATLPALAAFLPAYLGFVMPIFIALALRYHQIEMDAAALLTVGLLGAISGISYTINKIITRSITFDFRNKILLTEVTAAKEVAEQANQAKSRFLAAASHDLRQPLQALGLFLESIKLRINSGEATLKPLVQQCLESHDALSALLNSLLELSRLESNELQVHRISVPIRDLAGRIVAEFQPAAELKNLQLEHSGDDLIVQTDPVLFGRILRNLLSNAIKFTDQGNVSVHYARDAESVVLTVSDTGIGIPETDLDKVFNEYHQVANDARKRQEGIGLGLSVVRKMCNILKHPIELTSQQNAGTTFCLRLPLGSLASIPPPQEPAPANLAGVRVLVIDDDPASLLATFNIMEAWNCICVMAATLPVALQKIRAEHFIPDFILSDYRLEESNGIEVIKTLRDELGKNVPAILMSGDTDPALVKQIREQQFYLIHKPVKPTHLRKTMRSLLGR